MHRQPVSFYSWPVRGQTTGTGHAARIVFFSRVLGKKMYTLNFQWNGVRACPIFRTYLLFFTKKTRGVRPQSKINIDIVYLRKNEQKKKKIRRQFRYTQTEFFYNIHRLRKKSLTRSDLKHLTWAVRQQLAGIIHLNFFRAHT